MATDESYGEILEGLAIPRGSALQRDVVATLSQHDEPALGVALNKNQMASKLWLADALLDTVGPDIGSVLVVGGWFGVLPSVLLHDPRFTIGNVVSLDIDPRCAPVALTLNATYVRVGRFAARTGDMLDYDYRNLPAATDGRPNVIINTCCEHLDEFGRWYARIPAGQLLVLQSNDYYTCREHVNCVPNLATFRSQAPMRELLFAGEHKLRRYVRFMLIGRK